MSVMVLARVTGRDATGTRPASQKGEIMDDTKAYERREITRALEDHPEGHVLTLQIVGDEGKTRWLNVTPSQVRAIREIMGGGTLEDIVAALKGH